MRSPRRPPVLAVALLATVASLHGAQAGPADAPPWDADARAVLEGVGVVAAPGVPGALTVWGEGAFPLVLGRVGGGDRLPVVAAARWGRGRVVAFGHGGYLAAATAREGDTGRLLRNALRWVAGGKGKAIAVGVAGCDLAPVLRDDRVTTRDLARAWGGDLPSLDVLVLGEARSDEVPVDAVADFVRRGGGLLAAQTGWGWLQTHPGRGVREIPMSRAVAGVGLAWTSATLERTAPGGFLCEGPPRVLSHAGRAVETLADAGEGRGRATEEELRQAGPVATALLEALPPDDAALRPRIQALLARRARHLVPTAKDPLTAKAPLDRFLLAAQVHDAEAAEPADVRAHPAAAEFPGAPPADAKRATRSVPVDLAVPDWHGTGLWAPAGEPVVVRVPGSATGLGLRVRVGCHTDALWGLDAWSRVPEITREWPLTATTTTIASPFGGLVYVVVPPGRSGSTEVSVAGVVDAPRYVRGRTTAAAWAAARRAPGPWAELETSKVVLTVPSEHVRSLADPEALLAHWDAVLDAHADLAGIPRERSRPERIVADVQISAGYMHSGYPIMTHLDAAPRMADLATMRRGDWGLFHELGHNHQQPDWTFEGTGEVTVNLFTLHAYEVACRAEDGTAGHDAFRERARRTRDHVAAGAPFERWKSDPFLALYMYVDLKEAFGWEAYRRVFAEYRDLPAAERPRTDDAKRDQWLVRMSRAVGRDLGPFFAAWGVPVSAEARERVRSLPPWMPKGFPARGK